MSLRNFRLPKATMSINETTAPAGFAHLPSTVLDAFIPGYSLISKFVLDAFGFDVSILVSIFVLAFACSTGFRFVYKHAYSWFENHLMSAITVDAWDDIYDHILAWVAEQKVLKQTRSLRAKSGVEGAWDGYNVDEVKAEEEIEEGMLFNFANWEAKVPPRFEPHDGHHWFWHKGHYFQFNRDKETVLGGYFGKGLLSDEEKITLTVLGRSTQPIKDLIIEARDTFLSREKAKTVVRRPSPKEQRGRGRHAWNKVATRPSRPMETVVLDSEQKAGILADINEYLHPATPRWYANRGIPYRRGYLFHGPPGTGKTSLSFAIAGVFGLDIYCISLLEPTLTEEDLGTLFNTLPRRCVVLLEDIDSAGLHRKKSEGEDEAEAEAAKKKDGKPEESGVIAKEVARAFKNMNDKNEQMNKRNGAGNNLNNQGISLSGLLNAIDGVASHEGRVLVMTTNFPEKLDDALIRPGRVDMKIAFTLATREQIRELFIRMYCSDISEPQKIMANGHTAPVSKARYEKATPLGGHAKTTSADPNKGMNAFRRIGEPTPPATPRESSPVSDTPSARRVDATDLDTSDLEKLAESFASSLPDSTFSPAEIQGFLLMRKKDPRRAVKEVKGWCDEILEARRKAGKPIEGEAAEKSDNVGGQAKPADVSGGTSENKSAGESVANKEEATTSSEASEDSAVHVTREEAGA